MSTLAAGRARRPGSTEWDPRRGGVPWTPRTLSRWSMALGLGALGIAFGWYQAAGETHYVKQVGPIDLAIAGLLLAAAANIGMLLAGRRAVGTRRRALLGEAPLLPAAATAVGPRGGATPTAPSSATLVSGPGLKNFHRADCQMAEGKRWSAAPRAQLEREGRQPCRVCRP